MMGRFFRDDDFEFMVLLALEATYYKGTNVGECLSAAASIKNGDYESWYQSWRTTADRVRGFVDESPAAGRRASAREAFLRASMYYTTPPLPSSMARPHVKDHVFPEEQRGGDALDDNQRLLPPSS
jgi:hypothetical protein